MKFLITSIFIFTTAICFAQHTDTLRHNVITSGKITGRHTSCQNGPNDYYYHFEFNDRGRGPSINSHIKTNAKGNIVLQEISGVDYFKKKVEEKFEVKNGRAFWKNKFENESAVFSNQLYSNINGTPGESELSLRTLKARPSKKINILPSGNISFKQVAELRVADEKNNYQTIQLIGFTGLGGPPSYSWYNSDDRYFANVSEWTSIILEG